jgi:SagB-type dehydrogenase family enzyme
VRRRRAPWYRRSRHLVFFWDESRLVLHNYATGARVAAQPIVCEVLHFFDRWRRDRDLFAAKRHIDPPTLTLLLEVLVERSMLELRTGRPNDRERLTATWKDWSPAASFFHQSTKDLEYADLDAIERLTAAQSRLARMPSPVKRYRSAPATPLPRTAADGEFPDVLLRRRTWRRFADAAVDATKVAALLELTAGIQSWVIGSHGQKVALKTSPSGGARHALELYALVLRVKGIARGLYHYAPDRHALELVRRRVTAADVERYVPQQPWYARAGMLVFWTAAFERVQWRYTHPRAYRAVLIEAGHVCQTFCLTATWLGLAPFCTMALADTRIERDIGVDGITESVLYAAGIGARPSGVDWEPPDRRLGPRPLDRSQATAFPGVLAELDTTVKTGTSGQKSASDRAVSASRVRRRRS